MLDKIVFLWNNYSIDIGDNDNNNNIYALLSFFPDKVFFLNFEVIRGPLLSFLLLIIAKIALLVTISS